MPVSMTPTVTPCPVPAAPAAQACGALISGTELALETVLVVITWTALTPLRRRSAPISDALTRTATPEYARLARNRTWADGAAAARWRWTSAAWSVLARTAALLAARAAALP